MSEEKYLVDIRHEQLSFFTSAGEVKALNDVSIRMKEGEVLGIVGESGSGKSVTAYSIMGLTAQNGRIVGGSVEFNGHRIDAMKEKELRKIRGSEVSIIFQDPMTSLNPVIKSPSVSTRRRGGQRSGRGRESCWSLWGSMSRRSALGSIPMSFPGGCARGS